MTEEVSDFLPLLLDSGENTIRFLSKKEIESLIKL